MATDKSGGTRDKNFHLCFSFPEKKF